MFIVSVTFVSQLVVCQGTFSSKSLSELDLLPKILF